LDLPLVFNGLGIVLIAMAVRASPIAHRMRGIAIGAGGVVALRVPAKLFAARLAQARLVQLAGGLLILWIAVKLFSDTDGDEEHGRHHHVHR
jgi:predicted tellurium resistance membrane protein TerC